MDYQIREVFERFLNPDLLDIIISNSAKKEVISKIKIRPILMKEILVYQASEYRGTQVFHVNYGKEDLLLQLNEWFELDKEVNFKQVEFKSKFEQGILLISKKGKVSVKIKKRQEAVKAIDLSHNRTKTYLIPEGSRVPFLIDLGVMNGEGKIITARYDKYKQINRFLEFIEDILPSLPRDREITVLDFGCGKSYLTFAMYYYLKEVKEYNLKVIGLDLKQKVIEDCNKLAKKYGYDGLTFLHGDIAEYEGVKEVDLVVTLHACDTATDYALYKAIKWNAKAILSVPCCQHEFNKQIKCEALESIFQYGLIKERSAALFTDAVRANLLEAMGYKTQILEFIDMEHTPKNILIRAIKTDRNSSLDLSEYEKLSTFLGIESTLARLIKSRE